MIVLLCTNVHTYRHETCTHTHRYFACLNLSHYLIFLVAQVLATVSDVLIKDHNQRNTDFQPMAYHRFFIMLLSDLNLPDPVFDSLSFPVLHAFR